MNGINLGVSAGGVVGSAMVGYVVATDQWAVLGVFAVVAVSAWFVVAAPWPVVVRTAAIGMLIEPTVWPAASIGPLDLRVGDLLLGLVFLVIAARRRVPGGGYMWVLLSALTLYALARSDTDGDIAFLRIMLPLWLGVALAVAVPVGYQVWNDIRTVCLVILGSAILADGFPAGRWDSWAGGPNQTGLVAAVVIVLGLTATRRHRFIVVMLGLTALAGARSIAALLAAVVAVVIVSFAANRHRLRLGRRAPVLAAYLVVMVAVVVPILRPDYVATIGRHLEQAQAFSIPSTAGGALAGGGWAHVDVRAFTFSEISGLHNVYLDWLAFLGVAGWLLFAALVATIFRQGDLTVRVALVAWLVWINSSGAFPGAPWGLLGLLLAAAAINRRERRTHLVGSRSACSSFAMNAHSWSPAGQLTRPRPSRGGLAEPSAG